ncbi:ferrochelatase [Cyanobacterium sp. Dongsha4]|uniref:ferrochelatase n=1 Tax=Cyanobacterium sp. DS4 TaxID=2878255 RepID=UPI002E80DEFC|nr:ferrochelatase [Cyanobacterium sp. Dongsha4]WVL01784.1 ferrochelatase [Cyanobacterium sp. Dongsha4]
MVVTPDKTIESNSVSPATDRVAVILMGYGEVESYDDFANYNEQALNLLTAKFAPVPTWLYPPLAKLLAIFDLHEWSHQHGNFVSPHNAIFERQRAKIEHQLQHTWGEKVKVFKAFNFCKPHLPYQVLEQVKAEGFEKILIYPLLVVDSIFTSGIAIEQINEALAQKDRKEDHWVKALRYIPSFYNKSDYIDLLAKLVEEEIDAKLGNAYLPSEIGIVLMNHGCPHEAKGFTSGIDESQALYELVREKLIYRYPLISVGWLNHQTPLIKWTQPNAELAGRNLIELGAKALIFMPIGFATENHETLLDVEHIIQALYVKYPDINYVQMECVNDNEEFCAMAAQWVNPLIESLLTEEGAVINPSFAKTHYHGHHHHDHNHNHNHNHNHHHH